MFGFVSFTFFSGDWISRKIFLRCIWISKQKRIARHTTLKIHNENRHTQKVSMHLRCDECALVRTIIKYWEWKMFIVQTIRSDRVFFFAPFLLHFLSVFIFCCRSDFSLFHNLLTLGFDVFLVSVHPDGQFVVFLCAQSYISFSGFIVVDRLSFGLLLVADSLVFFFSFFVKKTHSC